jgi:8-oxo-dGTP pyrophosphatase MutT (NUDIX family)/ribonuclease HI
MKQKPFKIYIDAHVSQEDGQGAIGMVIREPGGHVIDRISRMVGRVNIDQAAFKAYLAALDEIRKRKIGPVRILSHSEDLVRQAQGIYRVMDPIIKQLKNIIQEKFRDLDFEIELIPYGKNQEAEQLARKALEKRDLGSSMVRMSASPGYVQPFPGVKAIQAEQHSAGGVVYRKEGSKYKICIIAKKNKSIWALPKGRVAEGETPEETAVREVGEETGHRAEIKLKIDEIQYFFYWRENNTFYHKFVYFYLMPLVEENAVQKDLEADAVKWVTPGEAYSMLTYINEKEVMRKARTIFDAMP